MPCLFLLLPCLTMIWRVGEVVLLPLGRGGLAPMAEQPPLFYFPSQLSPVWEGQGAPCSVPRRPSHLLLQPRGVTTFGFSQSLFDSFCPLTSCLGKTRRPVPPFFPPKLPPRHRHVRNPPLLVLYAPDGKPTLLLPTTWVGGKGAHFRSCALLPLLTNV